MMKKIPTLLFILAITLGYGQAQNVQQSKAKRPNPVMYKTSFYFPQGQGRWTENNEPAKMAKLLTWATADTTTRISITGWADNSGSPVANARISLFRARTVNNYLVEIDTRAKNPAKARRVDILGIAVAVQPKPVVPEKPEPKPQPKPQPKPEVIKPAPVVPEPVVEEIPVKTILRYYGGIEMVG